ncbi:PH domain-containing protein [Halococcus thailandensis]|uniref:Membrane-flanked domain-containing protein n=1 Tax=Halococcus thailandensis JCM 13552 TaxID=1227457 RepID=M0N5H9_9EURY|nr:PH domain-containing protein [Halococcus thailandensis]EMA53121.1 membrane-flanked domain-containing protein [Halococcus thailandensis JCM 13552]
MTRTDVPDWVTLTEGEDVLWQGHPSLRLVTPSAVVALALAIAGIALTSVLSDPSIRWFPLLGIPLGIAVIAWAYVSLVSTQYVLTDEEIYRKTGIVNQSVAQIRLDRVQNTTFSQSLTERLFSYGDITIYTAGSDTMDITLSNVPEPERVNQRLTEALDAASGVTRTRP